MAELVEVALPVYNGEKYIDLTLKSILNQTYKNFILTIYDNNSNDGTYEIIKKYLSDSRVRYKKNNTNIGATRNFMRALEGSSNKYMMWVAADDFLEPIYIEKCLKKLIDNPEAVACTTNTNFIDENNNLIRTYKCRDYSSIDIRENIEEHISGLGWFEFYALYRVDSIKGLEMKPLFGPDVIWTAELLKRGKILKIDEYLMNYRLITKSIEEYSDSLQLKEITNYPYTELYKNLYSVFMNLNGDIISLFEENLFNNGALFNVVYKEFLSNSNHSIVNIKYLESFYKSYLVEDLSLTEQAEKYSNKYSDFYYNNKEAYIWGAGSGGDLAYRFYKELNFNLLGFIDSDVKKDGQKLNNLTISTPEKVLNNENKPFIIIASVYYDEIIAQLKQNKYLCGEYW